MAPKERKIVFINQATGYLTIDIINAFAATFGQVALVAGSIRVQDIPLDPKVKWIKIAPYNRGNPAKKFFSWLWGTVQIFFLLLFRFRGYEVFYVTVPPTAYLLSLVLPPKFSVLVYDIYPEALRIFGIRESHWIYRLWQRWNRKVFKKAHRVYTLGNAMKNILSHYAPEEKIRVVNNWSGLVNVGPVPKDKNPFILKYQLSKKFVVQYSGNIGHTHNVETLLEVARAFINDPSFAFLIIGRGDRYHAIQSIIDKEGLTNCQLMPFQPDAEIQNSLSAADLAVVILDEKVAGSSIPSKTYNLLAVGAAFMVIGSEQAELAGFVKDYQVGQSFSQSDLQGMIEYIRQLKNDPALLLQYKTNALKTAEHFTYRNAGKYLQHYLDSN